MLFQDLGIIGQLKDLVLGKNYRLSLLSGYLDCDGLHGLGIAYDLDLLGSDELAQNGLLGPVHNIVVGGNGSADHRLTQTPGSLNDNLGFAGAWL
ncbi:Uncharacterised protein [uncultured archaeon]|nr:Uncharacterised protein [uncultured archaeon]